MTPGWNALLAWVGRSATATAAAFGRFGFFSRSLARAIPDVGTWGPLVILHMARLGVASLPIALFIAAFTGIVLSLQASYTFTGTVPIYFVGVLVGKTMILELGPVLTGLALAGRVGANIAAELGTMRVTEQIDALETLAYNPMSYLVVPRVLAGILMFPIIVAFANAVGIIGGWITAMNLLDMSSAEFVRGLRLFFEPYDVRYSLIKASSFGLVVTVDRLLLRVPHLWWSGRRRPLDHASGGGQQHADPGSGRLLGDRAAMSIRLSGVRKAFGTRVILNDISLEVQDGETVAVIGQSGAGKSVLLKTIVGLLEPDEGTVLVDGQNVAQLSREELYELRRQVGYVFQFAALFDSMSMFDNVAMGLRRIPDLGEDAIEERVLDSLRRVDMDGFARRMPGQLSGGQRKRVGLARAIATRPKYLLYDEPTTGLDPVTTAVIDELILRMARELSVSGLVITHDMKSAFRVANRIAMLYQGKIRFVGTPQEIESSRDPIVRGFVEGRPDLMSEVAA